MKYLDVLKILRFSGSNEEKAKMISDCDSIEEIVIQEEDIKLSILKELGCEGKWNVNRKKAFQAMEEYHNRKKKEEEEEKDIKENLMFAIFNLFKQIINMEVADVKIKYNTNTIRHLGDMVTTPSDTHVQINYIIKK